MPATPKVKKEGKNDLDEDVEQSPQHVIIITQENSQSSPNATMRRKPKNLSPGKHTSRRVETPSNNAELAQPPSYNAVILTGNQNIETFNLKIDNIRVVESEINTQRSLVDGTNTNNLSNRNQDGAKVKSVGQDKRSTIMSEPACAMNFAETIKLNSYRNIKTSEPAKRNKKQDKNQIQNFLKERRTSKSMKGSIIKVPSKFVSKRQANQMKQSLPNTARQSSVKGDYQPKMYQSLKNARNTIQSNEQNNQSSESILNDDHANQITNIVQSQAKQYLLGETDPVNLQAPTMPSVRGDLSSKLTSSKNISKRRHLRNVTLNNGSFIHPPEIKILSQPLSATNRALNSMGRSRFQYIQYGFQQLNQIEQVTCYKGSNCSNSPKNGKTENTRVLKSGTNLKYGKNLKSVTGRVLSTKNTMSPQSQRFVFSARGSNAQANHQIQYQNLNRKTTQAHIGAKPHIQQTIRQQTLSHENIYERSNPFQQVDTDVKQQLHYLQKQEKEIQSKIKSQNQANDSVGSKVNPINIVEVESSAQLAYKRAGTRMIEQGSSQQQTQMKSYGSRTDKIQGKITPTIQQNERSSPLNSDLNQQPKSMYRMSGQTPEKAIKQTHGMEEGVKTNASNEGDIHTFNQGQRYEQKQTFKFPNNMFKEEDLQNKEPQFADTGCQMSSSSQSQLQSEGSPSACLEDDKPGVFTGKSEIRTSNDIKNSLIGIRNSQNSQFIDNSVVSLNIDQILLPEMPESQDYSYRQTIQNQISPRDKIGGNPQLAEKKPQKMTLDSDKFMKCTPGPTVPIQFTSRRTQDQPTTRGVVRTKYSSNKKYQFTSLLCHGFNQKQITNEGLKSAGAGHNRVIDSGFFTQRRVVQDQTKTKENHVLSGQKIDLSMTANAAYIQSARLAKEKTKQENIIEKLKLKEEVDLKHLSDFEKSLLFKQQQIKAIEAKAEYQSTPLSQEGIQISGPILNQRKRIFFNKNFGQQTTYNNLYSDNGQTEKIDQESSFSNSEFNQFSNQKSSKAKLQNGQTRSNNKKILVNTNYGQFQVEKQMTKISTGSKKVSQNIVLKDQANIDLSKLNISKSSESKLSQNEINELEQSKSSIQDSKILGQIYMQSPVKAAISGDLSHQLVPNQSRQAIEKAKFPSTRNSEEQMKEVRAIKQINEVNSKENLKAERNNEGQKLKFDQNIQQLNLNSQDLLGSDRQGQVVGAGEMSLAPESEFQFRDPRRIISGATENSQESPTQSQAQVVDFQTFGSIHEVEPDLFKMNTTYQNMSQKNREKQIKQIYGIQKKPSRMSKINVLSQDVNTPQLGCYAQKGTDTFYENQLSSALLCNKNV